ncbi:hypothetical protein L0P88_09795 [Muricauda sp. SCSIO 64092]|uniref:hypothetical protein n=1 Tax=Allomuricauda sp. SCSIO 64092 TaxID=2908842 RepID=UPI001FF5B0D4|nr:hypothetical protein [Muricauda sp. SCSIO 64092]UOY08828.1 hypothetical protein L0P88_09795 [Muricauda sp. SCSIO 64092]
MKIANYLKNNLKKIPIGVGPGVLISHIPYEIRPGVYKSYRLAKNEIARLQKGNEELTKTFIFEKVKKIVDFAYNNITFYKDYYGKMHYNPVELNSFDDIKEIPIITKKTLQQYDLQQRSFLMKGIAKSNTGGSTGTPLSLYTNSYALGHEMAHLNHFWAYKGYKISDLKMVFVGRSNINNLVQYDFLRNSIYVDIYSDYSLVLSKLQHFVLKYKIKFLHGYPSAIFEFSKKIRELRPDLHKKLYNDLESVFYCSEYPYNYMRQYIEKYCFNITSQAFYGHTERCVIAFEDIEENTYKVLQSYGYAEVVDNELIGTSYHSFATPLIRYNTEDKVLVVEEKEKVLSKFSILEGRKSDFIFDKNNKKISLTGLLFGRHHKLFDYCDYIQVCQKEIGKATILYVTNKNVNSELAESYFDAKNVNIFFEFKKIDSPIKSISGKVLLKVNV